MVAGARNAECYTVSEVYWVDLVKARSSEEPVQYPNGFDGFDPVSLRKAAVSRCITPPRQGYHLAHPWCPAACAPGLERLSPSPVVAHHSAYDGRLVAPSRTSRETSVDGTLPWTAHCESLTSGPRATVTLPRRRSPTGSCCGKDALCLPRGGPHSLTAACCTTITNLGLN